MWRNRIAGVLVAATAACAAAACQTIQSISLDDPAFAEWIPIPREQSEVYFEGPGKPRVIATRMRWIEGTIRWEQVHLEPKAGFRQSDIGVLWAPDYFSKETSERFRSAAKLASTAHRHCEGTAVSEVREGRNAAGTFIHASCRLRDGSVCVFARQGHKDVAEPGKGPEYQVLAVLEYCSPTETVAEILGYLEALRFGSAFAGERARKNSI